MSVSFQLTFDANDPQRLAEFWALALGYVQQPPPEGFSNWDDWARAMGIPEENWDDARALIDPEDNGPRIFIQKVPEGKTAKNRLHIDINAGGPHGTPPGERRSHVAAAVERLKEAGASEVGPMEQRGEHWVVMQDPEGNEFCVQ